VHLHRWASLEGWIGRDFAAVYPSRRARARTSEAVKFLSARPANGRLVWC